MRTNRRKESGRVPLPRCAFPGRRLRIPSSGRVSSSLILHQASRTESESGRYRVPAVTRSGPDNGPPNGQKNCYRLRRNCDLPQRRAAVSVPVRSCRKRKKSAFSGSGGSAKMAGHLRKSASGRAAISPSDSVLTDFSRRRQRTQATVYRVQPMISRQDAEVLTAKKTAQRETVKAAAAQSLSCDAVRFIEIDASAEGQRLDNFLLKNRQGRSQKPYLPCDPLGRSTAQQRPYREKRVLP